MNTDPVTGISYQLPPNAAEDRESSCFSLLQSVASATVTHLQQGGYLSDAEIPELLEGYRDHLISTFPPHQLSRDFLIYLANCQAERHSVTSEDEVRRMQKLLRERLRDHVHYWSLGPLPGRSHALSIHYPFLKEVCELLLCPTVFKEEDGIIHVTSLNPIAGIVLAAYIREELIAKAPYDDAPFIFTFVMDYLSWETLQNRHFIL